MRVVVPYGKGPPPFGDKSKWVMATGTITEASEALIKLDDELQQQSGGGATGATPGDSPATATAAPAPAPAPAPAKDGGAGAVPALL